MDTEDERDEELATIAAIFPELILDPDNSHSASLEIEVAPSQPVAVTFEPSIPDEHAEVHTLQYLPPLIVGIHLPDGYPSSAPPAFTISTSPTWLSSTTKDRLTSAATPLWEEYGRAQTVFAYIDMLQQEAESSFGQLSLYLGSDLREPLLAHNDRMRKAKFAAGTYPCGVCLEPKRGTVCHRLRRCGHVFCIDCLRDFYTTAIDGGDVAAVKCLDPDCGGAAGRNKRTIKLKPLQPSELLEIPLDRITVQRYADMTLKKRLESDKSVIYCPRAWCQAPARTPRYKALITAAATLCDFPDDSSEPDENQASSPNKPVANSTPDRLAICSRCTFAFCSTCNASWHGDFVRCRAAAPAHELSEEDKASEAYIRLHTSPCPTCSAPCQKTHGCNHMSCFACNTHFCYLCGAWLSKDNPYKHFNERGKGCFMKLWELEGGDEDENAAAAGVVFGGARGAERDAEAWEPPEQEHDQDVEQVLII